MSDEPEIVDILCPKTGHYIITERPAVPISVTHPLSTIDPRCLELPSENWTHCKTSEASLLICEIIMPAGPEAPRVRKHVNVDISTGICTSYVMDRKISDFPALTKIDVERCVEELHMMFVCVGGPPVSRFPPISRANARLDSTGNWRHNSCKLVAAWTGVPCNACESLQFEMNHPPSTSNQQNKSANGSAKKRVLITNLSHRKQSQIIALRKRRVTWHRKKKNAEKEIQMIQEMISEISEEPEVNANIEYDDDDDD